MMPVKIVGMVGGVLLFHATSRKTSGGRAVNLGRPYHR